MADLKRRLSHIERLYVGRDGGLSDALVEILARVVADSAASLREETTRTVDRRLAAELDRRCLLAFKGVRVEALK